MDAMLDPWDDDVQTDEAFGDLLREQEDDDDAKGTEGETTTDVADTTATLIASVQQYLGEWDLGLDGMREAVESASVAAGGMNRRERDAHEVMQAIYWATMDDDPEIRNYLRSPRALYRFIDAVDDDTVAGGRGDGGSPIRNALSGNQVDIFSALDWDLIHEFAEWAQHQADEDRDEEGHVSLTIQPWEIAGVVDKWMVEREPFRL